MTSLEIVIGAMMAVLSGLLGALIGNRRKVSVDEFEKHRDSPNPHIFCSVHEYKLVDIKDKLDTMDEKIDRLLAHQIN
jgi:hypothetical protein